MSTKQRSSANIRGNNDDRGELLQILEYEKEKGLQNYRLYLDKTTSLKSKNIKLQEDLRNADKKNDALQQELIELRQWKDRKLERQRATMSQDQETQAKLQETQAELQETQAELQETQAELRETESERQRYASEVARLERETHHQKQSRHAQLQHRNDYLAQQIVEIEAQHQQSNARCAELEEEVVDLVHLNVRQELRLREADSLYRKVDTALKLADIDKAENALIPDLYTSSNSHVSRDLPPSAIATKKDLEDLVARICTQKCILPPRQSELKGRQL